LIEIFKNWKETRNFENYVKYTKKKKISIQEELLYILNFGIFSPQKNRAVKNIFEMLCQHRTFIKIINYNRKLEKFPFSSPYKKFSSFTKACKF
jgi:hypothetical protein